MRFASLSLCLIFFTGCAANGPSKEVGAAGGKIVMDEVGSINVPAGAFAEPTKIGLERRSLRTADKNVGIAGLLFGIEQPAASEVRIVAESSKQPGAPIELLIEVPRDIREKMKDDDRTGPDAPVLRAFAKNVCETDAGGKLITLEPLPGWSDPRSKMVNVSVPPYLFSKTGDQKTAATVRLALVQLVAAPVPMTVHPAESPFATTEPAPSADELSLAPPLAGHFQTMGTFGAGPSTGLRTGTSDGLSQFHPGVDLKCDASLDDAGQAVHAMAGGIVAAAGEQVDHDDKAIGFGGFVVIGHGTLGAAPYTIYAGLDPQSIRLSEGDSVLRGDVIASVAHAKDSAGALHIEYVPRPTTSNSGTKADPLASVGTIFVERLVAGCRSTALVRIPAIDTDSDSIEHVGNEADNVWWAARTIAKTSDKMNGRTLGYQSKTTGEVETIVDRKGLRVHFSADEEPRVDAGKRDASNPSEASAAGTGGGRIRFMTTTPSHYRLHVKYTIQGTGTWSIERRFQRIAVAPAKPTEIDKAFASFPASGKEAATFDQTFQGSLDRPGHFDFDFLPSIDIGGGTNRTARLKADATLEIFPQSPK